ncbi:MAG: hypothetical protein JWO38_4820 [Gemmataceae bacterium]|nr:hypothetical protein [Gemmataceae bacterium]
MRSTPLVAAVLHANAEDRNYQLYCAAYGLEMQIDDEWEVEAVLLAPHGHLHAVTEDTGVTGEDTAIVSAGVTDIPVKSGGKPDVSAIRDGRNNWLLVAGPGNTDTEETITVKLRAALDDGCRAILCFSEIETGQLPSRLAGIDAAALHRLVIAYVGPDAASPPVAKKAVRFVQDCLGSTAGAADGPRFIVGGKVTAEVATSLTAITGISGVVLLEDKYGHFGDILEVLAVLGGSHKD